MTQRSTGGGLIAGISMGPVANFGQHIAGTAGSTSLGSRAPHAVAPSAAVPYPPTDQPLGLAPPLQAASGGARAASPAVPPGSEGAPAADGTSAPPSHLDSYVPGHGVRVLR